MRIAAGCAIMATMCLFACVSGPRGADASKLPFKIGRGQGVFLHVSDIHFNPFADPTVVRRLIAAPIERWAAIFRSSKNTKFWDEKKDTSFPLLTSMLTAAHGPAYDYVLSTGDALAHDFRQEFRGAVGSDTGYAEFVTKTMRFVDRMLQQSFPGIPLISALGNNDTTCGDYELAPNDPMLGPVGRGLRVVARHPRALHDYAMGGFYAVPHPKVPNHDIVVLSNVFWSPKYHDACGNNGVAPGSAELAWLEWTLYQAKLSGKTVSLAMHIPPGIDAFKSSRSACPRDATSLWREDLERRFLALVARYRDQIRIAYAGHIHMDDFRVISDADGAPLLAVRMTPSVTPLFGNNPAFTVLLYSRTDANVADYATFYLGNLAKVAPGVAAEWKLEYTFKDAYKASGYDAATLSALAKSINTDDSVRATFMRYYAVASRRSSMNDSNWTTYACAQTAITPDAFQACVCPKSAPEPTPANAEPQ